MNNERTNEIEKEVSRIEIQFKEHQKTTNKMFDEILDKIKPQFTHPQITGFLISLVFALSGSMIYITDVKSDTRVNSIKSISNEKDIENLEKVQALQYINITVKLDQLIKDVAVLNSQKNNNK